MAMHYRVNFGDEFTRAILALGVIDKQIPRENNEDVRASTMRGVARAKASALTIPARGPKSRGTRRRISRGVGQRRTRHGYRITTSMPVGEEMLPRGFESQWRHPVFGGPNAVIQHSHYPWFTESVDDEAVPLTFALTMNLVEAARTVDRMV